MKRAAPVWPYWVSATAHAALFTAMACSKSEAPTGATKAPLGPAATAASVAAPQPLPLAPPPSPDEAGPGAFFPTTPTAKAVPLPRPLIEKPRPDSLTVQIARGQVAAVASELHAKALGNQIDAKVIERLGYTLLASGRERELDALLPQAYPHTKNKPELILPVARLLVARGRSPEARQFIKQQQLPPGEALLMAGRIALQMGQTTAAAADLRAAMENLPPGALRLDAFAEYGKAVALDPPSDLPDAFALATRNAGYVQILEALQVFIARMIVEPETAPIVKHLTQRSLAPDAAWHELYLLGQFLQRQKQYTDARALYEKAMAVAPQNPAVLHAYIQIALHTEEFDAAFALYPKLEALDPGRFALEHARALLQSNRRVQGEIILQKLRDEGGDTMRQAEIAMAGSLAARGAHAALLALLLQVEATGDRMHIDDISGALTTGTHDPAALLAFLEKHVGEKSAGPGVRSLMARLYDKQGKPREAAFNWIAAAGHWPDYVPWQKRLTRVYGQLGKRDLLVKHLQHMMELTPYDAGPYVAYHSLMLRLRGDEADRLIEGYRNRNPEDPEWQLLFAQVYRKAKRPYPAIVAINQALRLAPGTARYLHERAQIFVSMGELPATQNDYRTLLEKGQDGEAYQPETIVYEYLRFMREKGKVGPAIDWLKARQAKLPGGAKIAQAVANFEANAPTAQPGVKMLGGQDP